MIFYCLFVVFTSSWGIHSVNKQGVNLEKLSVTNCEMEVPLMIAIIVFVTAKIPEDCFHCFNRIKTISFSFYAEKAPLLIKHNS